MKDYNLYFLGPDGHISKAKDIRRGDDSEALAEARILDNPFGIELWEGARKVATVQGGSSDESRVRRSEGAKQPPGRTGPSMERL